MRDAELLRKAQAGDPAALDAVICGSDAFIRWCVSRSLGPRHAWASRMDAEDAEQEAKMALYQALLAWDPDRGAFTTLATTAVSRALRRWRQHETLLHVSAKAYPDYHDPATVCVDDPDSYIQIADTTDLGAPDLLVEREIEHEQIVSRTRTGEDLAALLEDARAEGAVDTAQEAIRVAEAICATPREHSALLRRLGRRAKVGTLRATTQRRVPLSLPIIRVAPRSRRNHPAMSGVWQLAIDLSRIA